MVIEEKILVACAVLMAVVFGMGIKAEASVMNFLVIVGCAGSSLVAVLLLRTRFTNKEIKP